jgi:hypothetical protein
VIGRCLKSLGHTVDFLHFLCKELADTLQDGDVHVADVPIGADILHAICQSQDMECKEKLQLLQQAIKSALQL